MEYPVEIGVIYFLRLYCVLYRNDLFLWHVEETLSSPMVMRKMFSLNINKRIIKKTKYYSFAHSIKFVEIQMLYLLGHVQTIKACHCCYLVLCYLPYCLSITMHMFQLIRNLGVQN